MSPVESFILMGIGGFFIVLGVVAFFWGKRQEKDYYDSIASRPDTREFLDHWPQRSEPGATKVGGWIAIALGLIMLIMSGAFLLHG
ncbi:hypothetical protein ACFLV3_03065 [Chloroflexota bacterium]